MIRPWHVWTIFGLCLAVVLAAIGWLSFTATRLSRDAAEAQRQAVVEENVRLALWRADSALAPILARENARPYYEYEPYYPAGEALPALAQSDLGQTPVPSALMTETFPYIRLHFQIDAEGRLSSPRVPPPSSRDPVASSLSKSGHGEPQRELAELIAKFGGSEEFARLAARLPERMEATPAIAEAPAQMAQQTLDEQSQVQAAVPPQQARQQQSLRNRSESAARGNFLQSANSFLGNEQLPSPARRDASAIRQGAMTPLWLDGDLFFLRRIRIGDREMIQGCRLDWPAIQTWLAGQIADLFPQARFEPSDAAPEEANGRRLASIPARLEPGAIALGLDPIASPVPSFLRVMWICVLLAFAAVALLLVGIVALSERRAAFVSAVTHELRTPLTTFRLYTDLLHAGLITDADKRRQYFQTLQAEAARLGHLVENVLAYARLERGRRSSPSATLSPDELLDRARERLLERAAQAGMQLEIAPPDPACQTLRVRANPEAVEQILFNLIDNACKYACAAADRRIHVTLAPAGSRLSIRVRDRGPGIAAPDARRLFTPFHKSAREAANSAPGVGLGLALSRRLARQLGGDLKLIRMEKTAPGACFELMLPIAGAK